MEIFGVISFIVLLLYALAWLAESAEAKIDHKISSQVVRDYAQSFSEAIERENTDLLERYVKLYIRWTKESSVLHKG
jgi:hypothetical protein